MEAAHTGKVQSSHIIISRCSRNPPLSSRVQNPRGGCIANGYSGTGSSRSQTPEAPSTRNSCCLILWSSRYIPWYSYLVTFLILGSKIRHFGELQRKTGIKHEDMLFFDDERRNAEVQSLGVTFILIGRSGMTKRVFEEGIEEWRRRRGMVPSEEA